MTLSASQRQRWAEDGYLVIPGFFADAEVKAAIDELDRTWAVRPDDVTVDDLVTGQRKRASQVDDADRDDHTFKVNDLYLVSEDVRSVALSERVGAVLGELLEDVPVMCNTLNLEKGSQQADHLDTLYMTPKTPDKLVATWMALEDVHPDAGPLRYWPGSHRVDPYRFSTGSMHVVQDEMDQWVDHMATVVDRHGLEQQHFGANAGDLLIWHAWLLHGGSPITDQNRTRNSLITHFWAQSDVADLGDLRPAPGGLWWHREPQPVAPTDEQTATERALAEQSADERAVTRVREESAAPPDGREPGLF
jgi:ectoine hydroxylase-related dioxygenase (phytanoyl-CoA dioxygenase family)